MRLEKSALKCLYDEEIGYGRVNWEIKSKYDYLTVDETSCAFVGNTEELPFYYRIEVPHAGNYKIRWTIESSVEESLITLFVQRRRCVLKNKKLTKGEGFTWEGIVNVSPIIPRNHTDRHEDHGIDLTVIGANFKVESIEVEEVQVPTLYLMGDSTCTDQIAQYPYNPFGSYCGWGQMFSLFVNDKLGLTNHAQSGRTTESFEEEGRWSIIEESLKPGDYVFMQFGHNDQKLAHLDAKGGYANNLRSYVRRIKDKEGIPVIITPVSRSLWNGPDHSFNDLLIDYANACKEVAEEENVTVVDLHGKSVAFILSQGPIEATKYFYPGDRTHFNDFGGEVMARLVIEGLKETDLGFGQYIKERQVEEIECKQLAAYKRPTWDEYQRLLSEWAFANEWVKEITV